MNNQDFIIRKSEEGFQVLEFITNCKAEIPCEYCKDRICLKTENQFYSGFESTKNRCDSSTIRYDDVKSAYVLQYDEAKSIFNAIENIVLLVWQYVMDTYERYKGSDINSGCFIRINSHGFSVCLDKILPEGEVTEYSIDDKRFLCKHNKYYKSIMSLFGSLLEKDETEVAKKEESLQLYYKKIINSQKIQIPENVYFNIKNKFENCLKTIFMILETKYEFYRLRRKYLSARDDDEYLYY